MLLEYIYILECRRHRRGACTNYEFITAKNTLVIFLQLDDNMQCIYGVKENDLWCSGKLNMSSDPRLLHILTEVTPLPIPNTVSET